MNYHRSDPFRAADCLAKKVAEKFNANALIPGVKGPARSGVKVNVRYGGDASQLSDIVRATLEFKMHPDALEHMYKAVEYMVYASELNGCRVSVTFFHDRYQHPFKGGYKDLLCLIRVNGFVCELQLNIDEMLKIKEGAGHTQYEKIRKVNDDLIDAAMKGDPEKLAGALKNEADPNASRDMYGLTPLHYAVHKGSMQMTQALLDHGANPVAQDHDGLMPIRRAILNGRDDLVEVLVHSMESQANVSLYKPLAGDLSAAALEPAPDETSIINELTRRIVSWEANNLPNSVSLIHLWADANRSVALTKAMSMGLHNEMGAISLEDEQRTTPIDRALRSSSLSIAQVLLNAGCRATKIFLVGKDSKLADVFGQDTLARSEALLDSKTAFQAAHDGDLATLEAYQLSGFDLTRVDATTGKSLLQIAVDEGQPALYPVLGIRSSTQNGAKNATVVLKTDGTVVAWGTAADGGDCSKVRDQLADVQHIYSTNGAFAALKADGSLVAWGKEDELEEVKTLALRHA